MKKVISKKSEPLEPQEYARVLVKIKKHIREAQVKAVLAANKELLKLYWQIGYMITAQQKEHGWGSKTVEKLAEDIQKEFPGLAGFSRANIFYMKNFYLAYEKVQQPVGLFEELPIFNIPWGHNVLLITKIKELQERLWYAQKIIENGWSRSMLGIWIESDLYNRQGKAVTNFKNTLPSPDSDIAQQALKDPYVFDFLTLQEEHLEHDIEQGLIENVQKMLLELGKGFALVARQFHLEVGEKDYYIDLLFYHTKLKCYIVVELKARAFVPGDVGQINFYLSAVDDLVRDSQDNPTLGLLLCKTKDNFTAEYALRGINKPIGVAEYQTEILKKLPKELKSSLPTIEEIEAEFEKNKILQEAAVKQKSKKSNIK